MRMLELARQMVEGLPIAAFVKDVDSVYVACNQRLLDDVGLKADQIAGRTDAEIFPHAMAEKYRADDLRVMAGGAPVSYLEPALLRGRWWTLRVTKTPLFDADGGCVGLLGVYTDDVELMTTREDLDTAQSRYRAMFDNMRSGVAVYRAVDGGLDFEFVDFNRAGERADNITRAEVLGRRVSELFPGVIDFGLLEVFRRVWRTGEAESFPLAHYQDDRISGWRENFVYRLPTGEIVAIYDDLTELKRNEAERHRLQSWLENFVRYAPAMIFIKDRQGRYLLVNERFTQYVGTPVEGCLGKRAEELTDKTDLAEAINVRDRQVMESGQYIEEETYLPGALEDRYFLCIRAPLRGPDGVVQGVCGIATDITDRKRGEEELRELKNRLDTILNYMPSAMIGFDAQGRVTQFNRTATELAHLTRTEALGGKADAILPKLPELAEALKLTLSSRKIVSRKRVIMRNGVRNTQGNGGKAAQYVDLMVYPLPEGNGAVARIDDVTERVHIEESLIHSEKMASVGGLAAGMAHEINNPLGGILQGAQNILRRLSPELPANIVVAEEVGCDLERIREYLLRRGIIKFLEGIRECGERAADIVVNMLEFSRRTESKRAPASVAAILDKSLDLAAGDYDLRKKYDFRKIAIRKEYEPDLPPLPCTATEIEQVMLNLLKNAAQALAGNPPDRPGPEIVLRARREGDAIVIEVEDNGPGMTEQVRRRVFEPFFTTKEAGQGTGLGLAVSYFIVSTNHGGRMRVESTPGKGSVFTVILPLR